MTVFGGSKGVSNHHYLGGGIMDGRCRQNGKIERFKGNSALKLGQVVYMQADFTVDVSNSTSDHDKMVGIVVGGELTNYQVIETTTAYNVNAVNAAGGDVLVQTSGIVNIIVAAAIAVGTRLVPDTVTAGRVKAATTVTQGAGGLGTLVVAGAPAIGTLDATIDAGATPVTSSAANGAVATVIGAPAIGTLAVAGAPSAGTIAGDSIGRVIGKLVEASTGANQIVRCMLSIQ